MSRLVVIFYCLLEFISFGWSDMGHRYTGIVAYNNCSEEIRSKVVSITEEHPEYQKHFIDEMPEEVKNGEVELREKWIFSQLACWPDVIKRRELNYSPQHRRWHYINIPIYLSDIDKRYYKNNVPVNLDTTIVNDSIADDSWNLVQAYKYNLSVLKSSGRSDAEKAVALCWIFHLVGDIHQPLHSSAIFSERKFVDGDKGGNAIKAKGIGVFHVAWDRSTYNSKSDKWSFGDLANYCDTANAIVSSENQGGLFVSTWMNESHELAKTVGYPAEVFQAIKDAPIDQYGFGNPLELKLDKNFAKSWKNQIIKTSLQRMGQSGKRIAAILKEAI